VAWLLLSLLVALSAHAHSARHVPAATGNQAASRILAQRQIPAVILPADSTFANGLPEGSNDGHRDPDAKKRRWQPLAPAPRDVAPQPLRFDLLTVAASAIAADERDERRSDLLIAATRQLLLTDPAMRLHPGHAARHRLTSPRRSGRTPSASLLRQSRPAPLRRIAGAGGSHLPPYCPQVSSRCTFPSHAFPAARCSAARCCWR